VDPVREHYDEQVALGMRDNVQLESLSPARQAMPE
jgi:hypothetical protein